MASEVAIAPASEQDVPVILQLITALAEYEHLAHEVRATEDGLRTSLFGERPAAEVVIARIDDVPVGFAVYFHNYSTFVGRPGLYMEDLFVLPEYRRQGIGRKLLAHVASVAVERNCGRMEWAVLDWNTAAIHVYRAVAAKSMDEWTVFRLTGDELRQLAEQA
ncbi:MAG: GNAT family N-acetyltransferase [Acidobacteriota bacterium]